MVQGRGLRGMLRWLCCRSMPRLLAAVQRHGYGPMLSFDVDITLVRSRLPGALQFALATGRDGDKVSLNDCHDMHNMP